MPLAASSGPFLDGVFISDAPEFERWPESERSRFARIFFVVARDAGSTGDQRR
jgi:hypothetical protein